MRIAGRRRRLPQLCALHDQLVHKLRREAAVGLDAQHIVYWIEQQQAGCRRIKGAGGFLHDQIEQCAEIEFSGDGRRARLQAFQLFTAQALGGKQFGVFQDHSPLTGNGHQQTFVAGRESIHTRTLHIDRADDAFTHAQWGAEFRSGGGNTRQMTRILQHIRHIDQ